MNKKTVMVKALKFFLLMVAIGGGLSTMAITKEMEETPVVEMEPEKMGIDVYWSVHEERTEDICKHYILLENETKYHVVIRLVYTDRAGKHEEMHHSQTWSDGGFKKRIYTRGRAMVDSRESSAEYM